MIFYNSSANVNDIRYLVWMSPLHDAGRPRGVLDNTGDVDGATHVHKHLGLAKDRSLGNWKRKIWGNKLQREKINPSSSWRLAKTLALL